MDDSYEPGCGELRIAYVVNSDSAYMYGGIGTAVYNLALFCDQQGWVLDIHSDRPVGARKKYMAPELYQRFLKSETRYFLDAKKPPMGIVSDVKDAITAVGCVQNFLRSLEYRLPDMVIYSDPYLALLAYSYRIHEYIPSFVYLHWIELFDPAPSSLMDENTINLFKAVCSKLVGIPLLTSSVENVSEIQLNIPGVEVHVFPLAIPDPTLSVETRSGILYMGGGDIIKQPELAAEILARFQMHHPDVPIVVVAGRGADKVTKLFPFAKILTKQSRREMAELWSRMRIGIHTSMAESFCFAVAEQMAQYPTILYKANYNKFFPPCPVFSTVNEGENLLNLVYYDAKVYTQTARECRDYVQEHYSFSALLKAISYFRNLVLPKHGIRKETVSKIRDSLSEMAVPLDQFYKTIGWGSAVLGAQSLKSAPPNTFELIQEQDATYIGLPDCSKGIQFLF